MSIPLIVSLFVGFTLGIFLIAYEDGKPFANYRKLKCLIGKHTFQIGFRKHSKKYFCQKCGVARKHPNLSVVSGGKKDINTFKF